MKDIRINNNCIKCGKCIKVCPAIVFSLQENKSVCASNPESCIVCGHCVAVCQSDAVEHIDFPKEKVHKVDYSIYPTPEQMMTILKARRSNRTFSSKPIPKYVLQQILEAAHRAPTASNMQGVEFAVITNPEILQKITNTTLSAFERILNLFKNPILSPLLNVIVPDSKKYLPTFNRLLKEQENGNDLILRGATAAIFIHTPENSRFGCEDANLAYQNGSLMAEALGIGQFYLGFVCSAYKQDKGRKINSILGLKNRRIHAAMALGIPKFRYENYIDKKDIVVTER